MSQALLDSSRDFQSQEINIDDRESQSVSKLFDMITTSLQFTLLSQEINIDDREPESASKLFDMITSFLAEKEANSTSPVKYYFSGESDSNQTKFESKSNKLDVGVKSNDSTVALVLLRLVRIIIDEHPMLLWWDAEDIAKDISGEGTINIMFFDLIKKLAEGEDTYFKEFSQDQPLTCTLSGWRGTTTISRNPGAVDWWDLKRVMNEIREQY